ncbi:alpha-crystallin B chain-like isoform X3 [Apis florea]|uniref:alpha-crystallin B chain-like isoform X3 n=1 Tax=Apis florea TaxID=7463 RepID=UPI000252B9B8|nr:alpha-crystallin B chain-like isoform X3 [Apis florea]
MLNVDGNIFRNAYTRISVNVEGSFRLPNSGETLADEVHAKHEEKTESKSVYREYNREFLLPKGTNPESIKSSLSKDGVLTVEAPLPAIGTGEKLIPIAHQ